MKKVLTFLNLLDATGNLSISNVAVCVCIAKLAMAHPFSLTEVGALLVSLLNYAHKRYCAQDSNGPNGQTN